MSLSHRGINNDIDTNIDSPQKLSYERSPSPDFSFDSSESIPLRRTASPYESRSPSPPTSSSFSSSTSYNSSPPHSPLSTSSSSESSPMRSPVSPYAAPELSPMRTIQRSRSLSPNHSLSSSSLSLPSHRSILAVSTNDSYSFSPLSPLKDASLRERCEVLLKSRSLSNKNDNFQSKIVARNKTSEFPNDSIPMVPLPHSINFDHENLKPGSSKLVVHQPSYSRNKLTTKIPYGEDNNTSGTDVSFYSFDKNLAPTSSLLERCEAMLKAKKEFRKKSIKSQSCGSPSTHDETFINSNIARQETLKLSLPLSEYNHDPLPASPVNPPRNSTTPPPYDSTTPPPYELDSHADLYSPPPYVISPTHSFLSSPSPRYQHDYPSVTISCASNVYASSSDNIMSVTVTTCSSTASNVSHSPCSTKKLKSSNSILSTTSGQQSSLYNPPLNPQDYQTSPPIYKSSTSVPDRMPYDFKSSLPSSSSIMYSYAPLSPHSLTSKVSSSSGGKSVFKLNRNEKRSTVSSVGSGQLSSFDCHSNAALKSTIRATLPQTHSPSIFHLPISQPESQPIVTSCNDSAPISHLKLNTASVVQSNEISGSSQSELKPCLESNKLFSIESTRSSNAICEECSDMDIESEHSSAPKIEPNLVIKTDSSVAEIVDVEQQGPPSVVDLTCEDDDDVEIVSTDQPVVFLGSEPSTRRHSRRQRHNDNSQSSSSFSEPIIISDSPLDVAGDSPSTAINIADIPDSSISTSSDVVTTVTDAGYDGHRTTPLLFGDLFTQSVIRVDSDNESRTARRARNGPSTSNLRTNQSCGSGKRTRGERNRDRSRSPLARNEDLHPVEAPIPPDVLDDIASIYAERGQTQPRLPVTFFKKNIFSTASDILHKAAFGLSNMCMLSSHSRPISSQVPQPSTSSSSSSSSSEDSGGLSCPICFETFQDIKKAGRSLSSTVCGHIFCTNCLEAALKQTKLCPTCRKRLNKKQYHPLYI